MIEKYLNKINSKEELDNFINRTLDYLLSRDHLNKSLRNAINWTKENLPRIIPKIQHLPIDYNIFSIRIDNDKEYGADCDCEDGRITLYRKPLLTQLRSYYGYLFHGKRPFLRKIDIESILVHEIVEHIEVSYLGKWQKLAHADAEYVEDVNRNMRKVDSEPPEFRLIAVKSTDERNEG